MNKAVLIVTFNRRECLAQVFAAVAKARPPRLYLASDGPRDAKPGERELVESIRAWMLEQVTWPCEVKTRFLERNSGGCGPGVSGAVTWFFENEKDGIVLEDDCVPSQTFFRYCEECLDRYANDRRVWHIGGSEPIRVRKHETYYFSKFMHCWGWASWADRWARFDLKATRYSDDVYRSISKNRHVRRFWQDTMLACARGEIETWDYQWNMVILSHGGLCITPSRNLVSNVGDEGVHFGGNGCTASLLNRRAWELDAIVHPATVECDDDFCDKMFLRFHCHRLPWPLQFARSAAKRLLPAKLVDALRALKNRSGSMC